MRALRLAETWVEVDRARHPLAPGVRAEVAEGELRVLGDGWSRPRRRRARWTGPAAAAATAAKRIDASVPLARRAAPARARRSAGRFGEAAAQAHAAACLGLASALAAADRDAGERHGRPRPRLDQCVRRDPAPDRRLGPQALVEGRPSSPTPATGSRRRAPTSPARPRSPTRGCGEWPPEVAGAMLRDLPTASEPPGAGARLAARRLAAQPRRITIRGRVAGGAAAGGGRTADGRHRAPSIAVESRSRAARRWWSRGAGSRSPARRPTSSPAARRSRSRGGRRATSGDGRGPRAPGAWPAVLELVSRLAVPEPERPADRSAPRHRGRAPRAGCRRTATWLRAGDLRGAGVLAEDEFAAKKADAAASGS